MQAIKALNIDKVVEKTSFDYKWSKVEESGLQWIDIKNPTGLNALYYLKDGKTQAVDTTKVDAGILCIKYNDKQMNGTDQRYTEAKSSPQIISVDATGKTITVMPNPLYNAI